MTSKPDTLLKTRQVARALGVGVSTIKRWVDSGEIQAHKTVGGHRLIAFADVSRFAWERGLPLMDLDRPAVPRNVPAASGPEFVDALVAALAGGHARDARELIRRAWAEGIGAAALADDILRPAMERIGHGWESGDLDVYQEHRASRMVEAALQELIEGMGAGPDLGPDAPLALGAAPEGDLYTISGLLCELMLREQGWAAMNLGPNLPLASLARAVRAHRPRLVWLSAHRIADIPAFVAEYKTFYAAADAAGAAVVLGGPALDADLRARLVAASFGDRMAHLAEFARRWMPARPVPVPAGGIDHG